MDGVRQTDAPEVLRLAGTIEVWWPAIEVIHSAAGARGAR